MSLTTNTYMGPLHNTAKKELGGTLVFWVTQEGIVQPCRVDFPPRHWPLRLLISTLNTPGLIATMYDYQ